VTALAGNYCTKTSLILRKQLNLFQYKIISFFNSRSLKLKAIKSGSRLYNKGASPLVKTIGARPLDKISCNTNRGIPL